MLALWPAGMAVSLQTLVALDAKVAFSKTMKTACDRLFPILIAVPGVTRRVLQPHWPVCTSSPLTHSCTVRPTLRCGQGGGEVVVKIPVIKELPPVSLTDEGLVKRIRGVAHSMKVCIAMGRLTATPKPGSHDMHSFMCCSSQSADFPSPAQVSPQTSNRMVDGARGVVNALLADVFVFTDHMSGGEAGASPGYGVMLVAETTSGRLLSAECSVARETMVSPAKPSQTVP